MDSDVNEIQASLLAAIEKDRNMFIKAKIDPMFNSVRPQVNALLEEILQKTKVNAEKQVSNAEFALHRMKKWFSGGVYASKDDIYKYNSICNKVSDTKDKFKTQSYFSYDDAFKIMYKVRETVDEIQASIMKDLNLAKSELESRNTKLNEITDKLSKVNTEKQSEVLLFIGFIVFFIFACWWVGRILSGGTFLVFVVLLVLILSLSMFLGSSHSEPVKELKTRQKELEEQISMLERRIAAAKESLL